MKFQATIILTDKHSRDVWDLREIEKRIFDRLFEFQSVGLVCESISVRLQPQLGEAGVKP